MAPPSGVGSGRNGEPVVAEMEEAMPSMAVERVVLENSSPSSLQGHRDGRLAVLEDLRDAGTPIELDFILQSQSQLPLNGSAMPAPGVTAIAPLFPVVRARPLHQNHRAAAGSGVATVSTTPHSLRTFCGRLGPSALTAGHRVGRFGRAGVGAALQLGRTAAGGVRKAGYVSGAAVRAAALAVVGGAAAAGRLSAGAAVAAGRAARGAALAAAAQPARLGRLLRRVPIRAALTAPLRVVQRPMQRRAAAAGASAPEAGRGDRPRDAALDGRAVGHSAAAAPTEMRGALPTTATPRSAEAAAAAAAAVIPAAADSVREPPVVRARSLAPIAAPSQRPAAERSDIVRRSASYESATAKPVPALLLLEAAGGVDAVAPAPLAPPPPAVPASADAPLSGVAATSALTIRAVPSRRRGVGAAAAVALRAPARVVLATATAAAVTAKYVAAAMFCAFFPKSCRIVGLAALLSGPSLPLRLPLPQIGVQRQRRRRLPLPLPLALAPLPNPLHRGLMRGALAPLAPLRGPFAAFAAMRVLGPLVAPAVWRGVMYWQRTVPIVTRYVAASRRAASLRSRGQHVAAEEVWQRQHEWGAGAIFDMLAELKGFYLKLGQILASKTDMLPQPYTESLSRLLDRLPPAPYRIVRRTIRAELGLPPEELFRELDPFPLASATIAQVHRGLLPDGSAVVVKVQHASARRMMRSDLANLGAMSRAMDRMGLQLGFDHGSLVREYNVQVPLEFDFLREARVATAIRASLESASASFPALRRVVVPRMHPSHSGARVVTMEYLDGVPLLDIAGMDLSVRHGLMTSLILAFGVMILRDGLFHSDPHPGNVLAMRRRRPPPPAAASRSLSAAAAAANGWGGPDGAGPDLPYHDGAAARLQHPDYESLSQSQSWSRSHSASQSQSRPSLGDADELQVALLDFGQAKQLSAASRARYAMLVAAMAVRDDDLVLAVSGELGLIVDNCSDAFAAAAAYILFDTRMDFPEAHMGPMDPLAHEFRSAKVPSLPQDLFMIMRTITLLRGLLSSLEVDVCSAQLWRPLALQVLADLTPVYQGPMLGPSDVIGPDTAAQMAADLAAVEPLDFGGSGGGFNGSAGGAATAAASSGGTRLPSPAIAAAVVEAASRLSGGGAGGSSRGSSGGGSLDTKAAAAERKRAEREAVAAARREEEARRRAEWEESNRRKQEEKEAKASRQRALKEAADARKVAERAEREARKRAEIEASNARRQVEREAAEAARRAEREAAAERRQSRNGTPTRATPTGSTSTTSTAPASRSPAAAAAVAAGMLSPSAAASPLSNGSLASPTLPPPPPAARVVTPGIIHSPMPVRLAPSSASPYGGSSSLGSRLAQMNGPGGAGGAVSPNAAAAAAASQSLLAPPFAPQNSPAVAAATAAAPPMAPTSLMSSAVRPLFGARPNLALSAVTTAPWAAPPPPTAPLRDTAGTATLPHWALDPDIGDSPLDSRRGGGGGGGDGGGGGGATAAGVANLPAIATAAGTAVPQPTTPVSPSPAANGRSASTNTGTGGGALASAGTGGGGGVDDEMDELTALLMARAVELAGANVSGGSGGSGGGGPSPGRMSPQQLLQLQQQQQQAPIRSVPSSPTSTRPGAAGAAPALSSAPGSPAGPWQQQQQQPAPGSPGQAQGGISPQQQPPLQPPHSPPRQVPQPPGQQQAASPADPAASAAPGSRPSPSLQQLRAQQQQLEQQLLAMQVAQMQRGSTSSGTPPRTSPNASPPAAAGSTGQQQQPSSTAAPAGVGTAATAAAATSEMDIVAQARALLESTRKLLPPVNAPTGAAPPAVAYPAVLPNVGAVPSLPGSMIVGGSGGAAGSNAGRAAGSAASVGGASGSERLASKRAGRSSTPPAMFLPSGMRAGSGGGGGSGASTPIVRKLSGEVSTVAGGLIPGAAVSEIEPAPAANGGAVFIPQVRQPSPNSAGALRQSMDAAAAALAAANGPTAAIAGVDGGMGGLGRGGSTRPSAEMLPAQGAEATAAAAGQRRTADGLFPQSDEDYGMWLARQQKASQPGSETSIPLQPQPPQQQPQQQSQLQLQPLPQPLKVGPTTVITAALVPMSGLQIPAAATAVAATAMAAPPPSYSSPPLSPVAAAAAASVASSLGSSTATGPGGSGGKTKGGSGMDSVKKGLSRIGKKIVGGLTSP